MEKAPQPIDDQSTPNYQRSQHIWMRDYEVTGIN
jgi:hypothetical protein